MDTIYKLPTWAETIFVLCVAVMLMGLAIWLGANALRTVIESEARLQKKRRVSETKALNMWKQAYDEEHEQHMTDVADMGDRIIELTKQVNRMQDLMAKVKVSEL
jgi:predicted PurR-regulated permease PerM